MYSVCVCVFMYASYACVLCVCVHVYMLILGVCVDVCYFSMYCVCVFMYASCARVLCVYVLSVCVSMYKC